MLARPDNISGGEKNGCKCNGSANTPKLSSEVRVILEARKRYGMLKADNGMDWGLSVSADHRPQVVHDDLRRIKGSDFEVVIPSPRYKAP